MLNMPHRCLDGQICRSSGRCSLKLFYAKFCSLDYVIRDYSQTFACVLMVILGPLGNHSRGWKSWTKIRNLLRGYLWMFDQSVTVHRSSRCERNAFVCPICIFAILTTFCKDSGFLDAWRHGEKRAHVLAYNTCLRKEHSGSSDVLLTVLCSRVLSAGNAIWATWSSERPWKALQNLVVIFPTTNAWRISGKMNLQFNEELMASFQPCRILAFGLC